VALLTPGPVSDQSWNGGAYDGLLRIRDSLGAKISNIQTATPADFEENFRQYGAQGYQLVFGHGFEFQDAAKRVAPQFPHTIYVTTSGTTSGPNLAGMTFGFADASYLAGMLAASMTKTNKLGALGGTALPPVVESFRAFEQGAKSVKPSIKVVTSYIGNWDDVSAGKEQALAQLAQGVDVIYQNGVAPDVTLGSVVIDLPLAFLTIAREIKNGTFKPGVIELGEQSHVVTLVLNPAVSARIPSSARTSIDSLQTRMESGAFHVSLDTSAAAKH